MSDIENKIREEAKKALESGKADLVIGWGEGGAAFKTTPIFITSPDDVDKLVWNPACVNNLAVYLTRIPKDRKIAIIAKPCDIRSIATLIQEKQIARENVYIIGLGCDGVIDPMLLDGCDFDLRDAQNLEWTADGLKISTPENVFAMPRSEVLRRACKFCDRRSPELCDISIGEPQYKSDDAPTLVPENFEARRKYWAEQFSKCLRCYACRQVCPACHCKKCFCDRTEPKWTAKKAVCEESWMFHATRVMHLAGRCIGCGECERVCPVRIPVAQLCREMNEIVEKLYGYKAGDPNESAPLLGQYSESDYDPAHHSE